MVRAAAPPPPARDLLGDPLPAGARARLGTSRLVQLGVSGLALSPNGKLLASVDRAGNVCLWEPATGKLRWQRTTAIQRGSAPSFKLLDFSADGKLLAAACADRRVVVWEVESGRHRAEVTVSCRPHVVRFAPDGRHLAIGGYDDSVLVWDSQGKNPPARYGDFKSVETLAYSSDGKTLFSVHRNLPNDRELSCIVWAVGTAKQQARHEVPWQHFSPALAPDGRALAVAYAGGKEIRLYDPATGKVLRRTQAEADYASGMAFSADGATLTAKSRDGRARLWDVATGKLLRRFQASSAEIDYVALSADGKRLALAGWADEAIHIWDLSGPVSRELAGGLVGHRSGWLTVAFSADGKDVLTVSRDPVQSTPVWNWARWSFRRWQPGTGRQLAVTEQNPGGQVRATVFSRDRRLLAVVTHEGTLRLWDVEAAKELRRWKVPTSDFTTGGGPNMIRQPRMAINDLVFSADGKVLLATQQKEIHRWDVSTGKALPTFQVGQQGNRYIASARCVPAPDGQSLLLLLWEGFATRLVLIGATSGRELRQFPPQRNSIQAVAFSPDGRTLALGGPVARGKPSPVQLLEVASGRQRGQMLGAPVWHSALAFSPDGRFLAGGAYQGVHVWRVDTGRHVRQFTGHQSRVDSLAFAPDGRRLASAGLDSTALVWDLDPLIRELPPGQTRLARAELDRLWRDLAGADAARAFTAIWKLAGAPRQSVPLFRDWLRPPRVDEKRLARLIARLDADSDEDRFQAIKELKSLGEATRPALRKALAAKPSAEVKVRILGLLKTLDDANEGPHRAS
jgi:WD40 repeat protein